MPSYGQLAASSLLNQQYAASLGLEKLVSPSASAAASSSSSSPSPQPVASDHDLLVPPPHLSKGGITEEQQNSSKKRCSKTAVSWGVQINAKAPGFPSIPVRKSPMVEQAVQTGPVENMVQKKPQAVKGPPISQQGTRQGQAPAQPAPISVPPQTAPTQNMINDENRRPQRRRSGNRRARNRSRGQNRPTTVKENAIKFDGDFDFESANAQFNREELDKEFKDKLNIKDDKPEKEVDEKGDSGVETQNSDGNPEEDPLGPNIYYDRTKSFFDNISSEMKSRRTTWAEEKKLNTETFGVSGRFRRGRSFRGGFRGGRGGSAPRRNQTTQRAGTGRV
ncbi:hypothetical protein GDO78_004689 [Eleutherodactylus coqui]|uniref:LSM family member 14B n=3 Tax=Eleutherodactylus coqui TaxID=57060 RepID=A0A8J6ET40_ELECQ|nr:hypothetical protein GDO78_004689 [Eleutherodactylus coqui]